MPQPLNMLAEFDILSELQFPDYIYSLESIDEQIVFSKYISLLSEKRILILHDSILNLPFVISGLSKEHIEAIMKNGGYSMKKILFEKLFNPEFLNIVNEFIIELDRREQTTENTTRIKNIIQYMKDNKNII